MKRLVMLAVLCAFVLSAAAASAADLKASGAFTIEAMWRDNFQFLANGVETQNSMNISERLDLTFEFIASENLKGVAAFRYGAANWGTGGFQMGQQGGNGQIDVWKAYVVFNWPGTDVNISAGMQTVTLPNAVAGSFILDEEATSVIVSTALTDNVSILGAYVRAYQDATVTPIHESFVDAYALALPLAFDGMSIVPFGVYANIGEQLPIGTAAVAFPGLAAYNATAPAGADLDDAYWLGVSSTITMFDPITIKADINYGSLNSSVSNNEKSGWVLAAAVEYTGMDMMTPELAVVYTSGMDGNGSDDDGRMPIIDSDYHPGTFFFGGERLLQGATSDADAANIGFWAVVLSLKDIQSFAEGLSHTFILMYAEGTNDKSCNANLGGSTNNIVYGQTLTEKDNLWEIDFNTAYQIYDELTASVDLGFVSLDADTGVWGANNDGGDAYKVSVGVKYAF